MCCAAQAQENVEAAPATQQDGPLVLTLDQALHIALSENPTVKIADRTIEAKKYAKRGTYAALWPDCESVQESVVRSIAE